jgi:peptide/nickel transport system substrate-binding protein
VTRMKRTVLASVAAVASVALVAACSGSSKGGGNKSNDVKAPNAQTNNKVNGMATTARSAIKPGGKMTWALSETIPNFNYYELDGTLLDNINVLNALLPNPFHFNAEGVASVNTDYFSSIQKTSDSPLTIDYKINPKAKWTDGSAVSWEDMADLWKASNGTNSKYNLSGTQGWDQISSVTRGADDQEAVVKFSKPYTDWQSLFAPLMPKSLTATPDAFNKSWIAKPLVTAGPFKWGSENKTAHTYTIVRDPNWWGDKAELDSITYVVYNDPAAAVQAIGSHDLDYDDITFGDEVGNVQAAKRYTGVDIRQAGSNIYRQFTLNTKDPILSDPKVRQAIVLGIDRKQITTALIGKLGGNPSPLQNHFFMKNQAPYTATCGQFCNYDAAKAKSLLQSAGWTMKGGYFQKGGKQLSVAITIPSQTPNSKAEAEIAQNTLKAVGVKLTLKTVPTNDFFAKYINNGNFQLTTFTWIGTPFPVGGALSIFKYNPKVRGQNYGFGGTEQINQLLASASSAASTDEENKLANQASQSMWENAAWLPLYQKPQATAVTSKLVNIGAYGFADIRYQDIGYKA